MDLDSFFVAVERLRDPRLQGRPVIVGGTGDRGVVSACSYEARRFGVHSAMPARTARQLCPEAVFIRGDFDAYGRYSDLVTELVQEKAPLLEKASVDEFYVDFTGMERFLGCYQWGIELRKKVYRELGLPISIALSGGKTVSKIAVAEAKPNGHIYVPQGMEKSFLQPLRVDKMPMIGEKTAQMLHRMGVDTVGVLAQIPRKVLERVFGKNGSWMWEKANGIDHSEIIPYSAQKSISKESTYSRDSADLSFLRREIIRLADELGFELRRLGQTCGCITLKIRYADFDTQTKQASLPYTASDQVLRKTALDLFSRLYNRRLLIRLLGIRLSKLTSGGMQLLLFDESASMAPLYAAMDRIRSRHGMHMLKAAALCSGPTHLKNEFKP
jgi:DNA polymerase-4